MSIFTRNKRKEVNSVKSSAVKNIKIQATTEGDFSTITLESLLTGRSLSSGIPGVSNNYPTYGSQVSEIYRKYNGLSDFGVAQTRSITDLRTAMIMGEGISISCEDKKTSEWLATFIHENKLDGIELIKGVKGSEMSGQLLYVLKPYKENTINKKTVQLRRLGYSVDNPFKVERYNSIYSNDYEVQRVLIRQGRTWVPLNEEYMVYVRTGGDDLNVSEPTTKLGVVLTDIENYDRAIKDLRRNNHVFARITPTFQVENESEAGSLISRLKAIQWKIGEAFIGKAKLEYTTPGQGAHENIKTELEASVKNISATTGVPVHWLGYVDLMSNRSTADNLYELIKQATILERLEWERAIYDVLLKAQEVYIDNGGTDLNYNEDFQVRLPLLNFGGFLDLVRGLTIAYADEAISIEDYRSMLPNIDPIKTKEALEAESEVNMRILPLDKTKSLMGSNIDKSNQGEGE